MYLRDMRQGGRGFLQFPGKGLNGRGWSFDMNGHPAGGVGHPAAKIVVCGQLKNKGPEPDPLYNTVNTDFFCTFHASGWKQSVLPEGSIAAAQHGYQHLSIFPFISLWAMRVRAHTDNQPACISLYTLSLDLTF